MTAQNIAYNIVPTIVCATIAVRAEGDKHIYSVLTVIYLYMYNILGKFVWCAICTIMLYATLVQCTGIACNEHTVTNVDQVAYACSHLTQT